MHDHAQTPGILRILSDLHLGHPGSKIGEISELEPLIEGASTIIFNGDTFEQRARWVASEAERKFQDLLNLCKACGANPVFLTGNHDPDISTQHQLDLCGGQVFVTHGDVLFELISPWSKELLVARERLQALADAYGSVPSEDFEARMRWTCRCRHALRPMPLRPTKNKTVGKMASIFEECFPPRRLIAILKVWQGSHHTALRSLPEFRPKARFFIYGHTHYPVIHESQGLTAINTGSFHTFPGMRMVEIEGEHLSVLQVKRNGDVFRPTAASHRFRLQPYG